MILEGGLLSKHGKKTWTTPVHLQVSPQKDRIILKNPETKAIIKEIPIDSEFKVNNGKNSHFHFYAVERHCFSLHFGPKSRLNLETKTELDRDKWVAAFRWLIATKEIIAKADNLPKLQP